MRAYRIGYTRARLRSLSCLAWIETDSTTDLIEMHDWTHEPSMSSVVSVGCRNWQPTLTAWRPTRPCRLSILTVSREQTCTTARHGDPSRDVGLCVGRECWLSGRAVQHGALLTAMRRLVLVRVCIGRHHVPTLSPRASRAFKLQSSDSQISYENLFSINLPRI